MYSDVLALAQSQQPAKARPNRPGQAKILAQRGFLAQPKILESQSPWLEPWLYNLALYLQILTPNIFFLPKFEMVLS